MKSPRNTVPVRTYEYGDDKAREVALDPDAQVIQTSLVYRVLPLTATALANLGWTHRIPSRFRLFSNIGLGDLLFEPVSRSTKRSCVKTVRIRRDLDAPVGEGLHPLAGKRLGKVSLEKVYGLPSNTQILFNENGTWVVGEVRDYPRWREAERKEAKAEKKLRYRRRQYLRQPTVYDILMQDD